MARKPTYSRYQQRQLDAIDGNVYLLQKMDRWFLTYELFTGSKNCYVAPTYYYLNDKDEIYSMSMGSGSAFSHFSQAFDYHENNKDKLVFNKKEAGRTLNIMIGENIVKTSEVYKKYGTESSIL